MKDLHTKLRNKEKLFKSIKQLEWLLEILASSFLPPQNPFITHNSNYLHNILALYEYILCGKVALEFEGKSVEFHSEEVIFSPSFFLFPRQFWIAVL